MDISRIQLWLIRRIPLIMLLLLLLWLLPKIINRLTERAGIRIKIERPHSASPTRTLHPNITVEHHSCSLWIKLRLCRRVITTRGHSNISIDTVLCRLQWNLLNRMCFLLRSGHVVFCIHWQQRSCGNEKLSTTITSRRSKLQYTLRLLLLQINNGRWT